MDLDGQRFAYVTLNPVLRLDGFIKLNPLGIPAEHRILDRCKQFGHGGMELVYLRFVLELQVSIKAVITVPY